MVSVVQMKEKPGKREVGVVAKETGTGKGWRRGVVMMMRMMTTRMMMMVVVVVTMKMLRELALALVQSAAILNEYSTQLWLWPLIEDVPTPLLLLVSALWFYRRPKKTRKRMVGVVAIETPW